MANTQQTDEQRLANYVASGVLVTGACAGTLVGCLVFLPIAFACTAGALLGLKLQAILDNK